MAIRATFSSIANTSANLWIDANSVRPELALDDPELLDFVAGGGTIEPYEIPPAAPTLDEMDKKLLNQLMMDEGSFARAIAEIQFMQIKGTLPVTTSITAKQYKDLIELHMRTRP